MIKSVGNETTATNNARALKANENKRRYGEIGDRIKKKRIEKGFKNGHDFYAALYPGEKKTDNAADKYISDIETGVALNLDKLIKISKFLGVSIDYLVTGVDPDKIQNQYNALLKKANNAYELGYKDGAGYAANKHGLYSVFDVCKALLQLSPLFDVENASFFDIPSIDSHGITLTLLPKIETIHLDENGNEIFDHSHCNNKVHFSDNRASEIIDFFIDALNICSISDDEFQKQAAKNLLKKQPLTPLTPVLNYTTTKKMLIAGDSDIYQYRSREYFSMTIEKEK